MRPELASALLAVVAACADADPGAAAKAKKAIAAPSESADQYALLADIRAAQSADRDERDQRYAEVSRGWRGRRVRWEVAVAAPLCARPDACMVMPFDHTRLTERADQGWLPRVELSAAEHARIREACTTTQPCVVALEATVREVRLTTELPTAVTLREARMVSARALRSHESFARAPVHPSALGRVL